MEIRFLADAPGHVDTLAGWHHAQWGALYRDWSRDDAAAELRSHAACRTRPTTLVAFDGDALVGSVSLVDEDAPEFADRGDAWLASLYVVPGARGRGIGAALARALVAHAAGQGVGQLWLFTPEHAGFYAKLGWAETGKAVLGGTAVTLMSAAPGKPEIGDGA